MRTPRQEYLADPKPNLELATIPSGKYVGLCAYRLCGEKWHSNYAQTKFHTKACWNAEHKAKQDDKEKEKPKEPRNNTKEANSDSLSGRYLRMKL